MWSLVKDYETAKKLFTRDCRMDLVQKKMRQVSKKVIVLFTESSAMCSFTCEELLQAEFLKIQENLNQDITNQARNL